MLGLGLKEENTASYWITEELAAGEQTDKESLAVITWAWRALYACTTKTHLEGAKVNLKVALLLTFRYTMSRTMRWPTAGDGSFGLQNRRTITTESRLSHDNAAHTY
jgi:hypothetical protein